MLKEENVELLINGKRVENDYTFVADDEEMKVEISYTFNASALGGKNLVTFEELYDLSNPDEPVKVAEHKDIEDDGQTVLITERIVKIHTTATDKDGNKEQTISGTAEENTIPARPEPVAAEKTENTGSVSSPERREAPTRSRTIIRRNPEYRSNNYGRNENAGRQNSYNGENRP